MIDTGTVASGLERLTQWFGRHDAWSCGMAFATGPVFEESYAVRAAIAADRAAGIGRVRSIALSFCDRVLGFQGLVEPCMYYMGYGNNVNAAGVPGCSCVADAASTGIAIVETLESYPDAPNAAAYRDSLRRFADYVLATYRTPDGVIGVGILGHKPNPWTQYWCANSLFACVLIGTAGLTGESRYLEAAVAPLEYLGRYDYRATTDRQWELSPTEMIFYATEGILAGLGCASLRSRLALPPRGFAIAGSAPAGTAPDRAANKTTLEQDRSIPSSGGSLAQMLRARWEELAAWLRANQDPDGSWPTTKPYSCYQAGLTWTMLRAASLLDGQEGLETCVARQLAFLASSRAGPFLGTFCNVFASGLAYLSFASAATVARSRASAELDAALAAAHAEALDRPW